MITHAAYHAANPLPRFPAPLWIERGHEPPIVGRVHRIAVPADAAPKILGAADYIAALSKTEWRTTAALAEALGVAAQTVVDRMARPEMVAVTEKRTVGSGGRYEWRLR